MESTIIRQDVDPCAYVNSKQITCVTFLLGVFNIHFDAFQGCKCITTLHFSEDLNYIGVQAFALCESLSSLSFPESLQSIEASAFRKCPGIKSLHFNEGLVSIGEGAFWKNTGLETVVLPDSVVSVRHGAFLDCTSLARVIAPDKLIKSLLDNNVFDGCPVLDKGITPYSAVPPLHRTFWYPTMHSWCTAAGKECVLAMLFAEHKLRDQDKLWLPIELWLLILQCVPRHQLGRP